MESRIEERGGAYVTVLRDLEFCTNVRNRCDVPPRVVEVRTQLSKRCEFSPRFYGGTVSVSDIFSPNVAINTADYSPRIYGASGQPKQRGRLLLGLAP